MKLSAHYNKASIIITISVLLVGAVVYYFAINYIADTQLNGDLTEEIGEVIDYINLNGKLPQQKDFDEDQTSFVKTKQENMPTRFFDTVYRDPNEKYDEAGRAISGVISVKGQHYIATITVSRESTEYLVQIIGAITLALMVSLLLVLFITNRFVLNGLWRPFYDTLSELKTLNISDSKNFKLKPGKVDEFNELNKVVETMSARVKNDYLHLKHFTENASHEMLTPLAVITAKLDTLIQDETLKPDQLDQITDIYLAAGKLSKLNQSLLLLVKIENNLVEDAELLNLDGLISQKIRQFNELINSKDIAVSEYLEEKEVLASKYLIDILLNNLFSNAIRHNVNKGRFIISLNSAALIFQNTAGGKPLNAGRLFERFQKGQKSEGSGLGLTIVKNICTLYNWTIQYSFEDGLHTFRISF